MRLPSPQFLTKRFFASSHTSLTSHTPISYRGLSNHVLTQLNWDRSSPHSLNSPRSPHSLQTRGNNSSSDSKAFPPYCFVPWCSVDDNSSQSFKEMAAIPRQGAELNAGRDLTHINYSDYHGLTGAEIIHKFLLSKQVHFVFGYSGGAVLPLIDQFYGSPIQFIPSSHEQCSGHSAESVGKVTGIPGVCIVTSGPGMTNTVTPMQDALMDGVPLMVLSGQVPTTAMGTDAFQEAPATAISKPCCKWSFLCRVPEHIPWALEYGWKTALKGRKGPVHIDLPKNVLAGVAHFSPEALAGDAAIKEQIEQSDAEAAAVIASSSSSVGVSAAPGQSHVTVIAGRQPGSVRRPSTTTNLNICAGGGCESDTDIEAPVVPTVGGAMGKLKHRLVLEELRRVIELINTCKKPVLYVGHGAVDASDEVRSLAIKANIPVATTLHGMGVFDELHPLSLHMLGMHGSVYANYAMQSADVVLAVGARFDDRATGLVKHYAPAAFKAAEEGRGGIVHFEIEKTQIGRTIEAHHPVHADCREALKALLPFVTEQARADWIAQVDSWKRQFPFSWKPASDDRLKTQQVIAALYQGYVEHIEPSGKHITVSTGVGNHQMMSAQFFRWRRPRQVVTSGGLGTMGSGLPFAIGAQVARPDDLVLLIDGDGCFNMSCNEIKTVANKNLPIKIAVMNDGMQQMVASWQKLFF
eukprot:GHVN01076408.1.p1 GENE.GHVN01076408.1~~GHVN01076408.1.p1  ORF type:complete len:693 (+),score=132.92 GHVN01076408.1:83-2161(+)